MGKAYYQEDIIALFKKSAVVSYNSIDRIIKAKNNKIKQYTKQLVRNLVKSGRIKPLAKGYYSLSDDPSLLVFCYKPAYLGLQDAMSFHGVWEQETIPVVITARKIRQGIKEINGTNVNIRRIDTKYLFGIDYYQQNNVCFPYSDIEKTFIDMVYFNENIDDNTIKNFKKKIDKNKLKKYLKDYSQIMQKRVNSKLL